MEPFGPGSKGHRAKMTKPRLTDPKKKSTPENAAAEISFQLQNAEIMGQAEQGEMLEAHRKAGGTLAPSTVSKWAIQRLDNCGKFPRGMVGLEWADGTTLNLGAHQCNNRLCPRCGRRRAFRLSEEMTGAMEYLRHWGFSGDRIRFATLTIPNSRNVAEGLTKLAEAWHRTLATKSWGRMVAGTFRAFEVKAGKDGRWNVHLHAILYLWRTGAPYSILRRAWDQAAGGKFNQRFDLLRDKAKSKPGQSKADAAARYLVKYLTKVEDSKETRTAPGGLPHLLAALEGRRMWGATGAAAEARRIFNRERPAWTATIRRAEQGYAHQGNLPVKASLLSTWGESWDVPIPKPCGPAILPTRAGVVSSEDQDPTPGREKVIDFGIKSPFHLYDWQSLPTHRWDQATWEAWADGRPFSLMRDRARQVQETRQANRRYRAPRMFRWRAWRAAHPWKWTHYAADYLGSQTMGSIGALLWGRVTPSEGGRHVALHAENLLQNEIRNAVQTARKTLTLHLRTAYNPTQRQAMIARELPLPAHLTRYFMESDL